MFSSTKNLLSLNGCHKPIKMFYVYAICLHIFIPITSNFCPHKQIYLWLSLLVFLSKVFAQKYTLLKWANSEQWKNVVYPYMRKYDDDDNDDRDKSKKIIKKLAIILRKEI